MGAINQTEVKPPKRLWGRIIWGFTFALSIALSAYLLINASKANNVAFGSLWFLAILPAYLCALICYLGDPDRDRPISFYWLVPPVFTGIVVLGSSVFLREGVICLIMLSPIWLCFGWLGAFLMRWRRKRPIDPGVFRSSLLLLPLFSGAVESQIPFPHDSVTLTREIVVHATLEEIWPYAVSNANINEDEGRWTFTQNIVGLPRPRATVLKGEGMGAVRTAYWGDKINFEEKITQWQPGRVLGWSFSFANSSLQDYTDRHISPNGLFLKIDNGEYTMTPLSEDVTLLTLRTRYIAKTHVNLYAELWGEILLGDIENNILAIIKHRAEVKHGHMLTQR
jgi:hypothetical protein